MDGGQARTQPVLHTDGEGKKSSKRPPDRRWRRYLLPLLAYALFGLALTWPMTAHLATRVPGDGIDDPALAWNLWWIRHSLVDQPQNPFNAGWQFWPVGVNLAFYTLTILNGLLSISLQLVFGLIPAYNLLLLSSFTLSGFGAYLLCADVLGRVGEETRKQGYGEIGRDGYGKAGRQGGPWGRSGGWAAAAFVGGALYAFAAPKLFYAALGQGNIASSQWIPFAVLYMMRAARPGGKAHDAAMAALFAVLQAYAELTYASFLLIFGLMAVLWGLVRRVRRQGLGAGAWSLIGRFLLIALLVFLGVTPFLANMLPDLRAEGDLFASGGGFADLFSADLAGYLLPSQLHPLLGDLVRQASNDSAPRPDGSHWPVDKGQQVYVGYVAMLLALIGLWSRRRSPEAWFWAVAAAAFFLLTLGPSLRIAGYDQGIPLPFAWVARLPFFEGNRYPSRYSVMVLVCMAPLTVLGLRTTALALSRHPAGRSVSRDPGPSSAGVRHPQFLGWLIAGIALAGLLFEHSSVPLPLSDLRVPELYRRVAEVPGDFALLEVPPGWRNGARVSGKMDNVIMQQLWNQTVHGKRVLGGNTSRNPEFKFQYFSENSTLALLLALTNAADLPQHAALREALASRQITEEDRSRATELAGLLRIRYVMVHRDKIPPEAEAALAELLPLEPAGQEGSLALYKVEGNSAVPRSFRLGDEASRPVLGEGWSPPTGEPGVYAQRLETRLLLPLPDGRTKVRLYGRSLAPNQQVSLAVDGREIASGLMSEEPDWLVLDVPAAPGRPPLSDVRLRFSKVVPIAEIPAGRWAVGKTGAQSPVSILARSAGQEAGDFAHLYVDGVDLSLNERGYNLVALDPLYGNLVAKAAFDTHAEPAASARLAAWVRELPQGAIVAGAARDEASMSLSEEAVTALRSLGVMADLRGRFRWGHAFIGAAGAPAGSAVEALDGIRTAQASVGLPVSGPQVAAWLSDVVVGE